MINLITMWIARLAHRYCDYCTAPLMVHNKAALPAFQFDGFDDTLYEFFNKIKGNYTEGYKSQLHGRVHRTGLTTLEGWVTKIHVHLMHKRKTVRKDWANVVDTALFFDPDLRHLF